MREAIKFGVAITGCVIALLITIAIFRAIDGDNQKIDQAKANSACGKQYSITNVDKHDDYLVLSCTYTGDSTLASSAKQLRICEKTVGRDYCLRAKAYSSDGFGSDKQVIVSGDKGFSP